MKNLEFRFTFLVVFMVVFACAQSSVNADIAPDSDIPGNSEENSMDHDPRDYLRTIGDQAPGINNVDDDDEDDDSDIGDEGFFDEDEDDDDGSESLGQSVAKGSGSSVVHKKDKIHHLSGKHTSPQEQQLAVDTSADESGSSDDSEGSNSGNGSETAEARDQRLLARQHVSGEEDRSDEDTSAEKDKINDSDEGEEEQEIIKHDGEHAAIRSRFNTTHKHPRNLIKKVLKETEDAEQEENTSTQEQDDDEENSGQDSGSSSRFVPGSENIRTRLESEHSMSEPLPKNMTGVETHTSAKEETKEKATIRKENDRVDKGSGNIGVRLKSEHPISEPHPKNMTGVETHTSAKEEVKEKITIQKENNRMDKGSGNIGVRLKSIHPISEPHPKNMTEIHASVKKEAKEKGAIHKENDRKDKESIKENKKAVTSNSKDTINAKSTQQKDTSLHEVHKDKAKSIGKTRGKTEHINVQTTSLHKKLAEEEPIRTSKGSPHLAKKKLQNKYLAAHVTHPHVVKSHTKVTHSKPVSKAAPSTCHSDNVLAGHSLKGGTRAGRFEVLGETASMHACLQRCCSKQTCDVALLIDGRCYGVACYSEDLCEAIPVPHPHFIFSQLGFVNKGQKRGDIERKQEFHCQYGNLTLQNNEQWSGELCGGVVRCKDGIATVKKCAGIPPKPDDCAKPRLLVKHQSGKCCQMKWKCKARHCIFNNRLIKHGYKLSDPLCTGVVSCYNGHLKMEYCPKIPDKPKDCARPKLKTINIPGKCCKKLWVCSDKSCKYDGLKLSHGEKLTDASCAVVMECRNGFLHNKQCPGPPPVPHNCINPSLKVKRIPGECCDMNWTCEIS